MTSGIYQIKNTLNGKCYIGSAVALQQRWAVHLSTLRRGKHYNLHLQRAFDKYGEAVFTFTILEYLEDSLQLILREQYCLDTLNPEYNISPTAGSTLGVQHTAETCAKTGRPMNGELNPMYGKHHSEETLAKLRAARVGKLLSEETLAKLRATMTGERNPMYGKHHSAETRAKQSIAKTGERNPNYGKHLSEDIKRKMSIAQKARRRRERAEEQKN